MQRVVKVFSSSYYFSNILRNHASIEWLSFPQALVVYPLLAGAQAHTDELKRISFFDAEYGTDQSESAYRMEHFNLFLLEKLFYCFQE